MRIDKEKVNFILTECDLCDRANEASKQIARANAWYEKLEEMTDKLNETLAEPAMNATELINKLRYDIKCINDKLERANVHKNPGSWFEHYLNDYQVVRLKAIRMKCKEIIKLLTGGKE